VALLPQAMLARGALGVVGHIDQAWGFSIQPDGLPPQIEPFRNFLGRVLSGRPIGFALRDFAVRASGLAVDLLDALAPQAVRPGEDMLAWAWTEQRDARNYALLGDPAVQLNVG